MPMQRPKAEVFTTDRLDSICIVPESGFDRQTIRKAIKGIFNDIPMRSLAEGVSIPSQYAHLLLGIENAIDLKWRGDSKLFAENRLQMDLTISDIRGQVETIKSNGVKKAEELIADLADKEDLDNHQRVNVAAMTLSHSPGLCVFDEQGTGKTVTVIYAFDLLVHRDEVDIALVLAPKSMIPEWPVDLHRFKSDLYKSVTITGNRREKRLAINSDADFFVTNYETAVLMEKELTALLRRRKGRAMLVVDESFYVKNLDAKRTRAIRRLREHCERAFVLCGTPAPNSPHDLIQQFNIVDFGYTFEHISIPEDNELARPVVQRVISDRGLYIRHLKTDVLPDLPLKRFNRVIVPLNHEQKKLYEAALKDLILNLRSIDDSTFQRQLGSFLARRSALLQICSNPVAIAGGYNEVPAKLQALDGLLDEVISVKREKVILWSFYTASISAIFNRYQRFNPVRYDGTVSDVTVRREAVHRFQRDNETMLFVANPAAAGAGLTLHRARFAIYESMSNQAAHYLQSIDRIHRRGQTRDVEYLILLCDKTIEIDEYDRLLRKERSAQGLLGDHVDEPVTREAMLSEAINSIRQLGEGYEQ
jgi:SNF2 family DNA or RNA helicase